jgi:hypothetical protein
VIRVDDRRYGRGGFKFKLNIKVLWMPQSLPTRLPLPARLPPPSNGRDPANRRTPDDPVRKPTSSINNVNDDTYS